MSSTHNIQELLVRRKKQERIFIRLSYAALGIALGTLALLFLDVLKDGAMQLNWKFLSSFPSRRASDAGIFSALVGSFYMVLLTISFAIPLGVGAAIYLEEYAPQNRWTRLIELNIANLAGIPSIIYGLLGLEIFVRTLHLERSLLAGSLTMALLVLPIIIISAREAIRAVPRSIREAAYALGTTKWQMVKDHVLPLSLQGILTGVILAVSRAIGETAPLITIGALTYVAFLPSSPFSPFTVLPIQIFNWVSRPQEAFHGLAAAGILLLLAVTLSLNAVAILMRNYYQKRSSAKSF
jgi:phosphate transport system permease protein